MCLPVYPPRLRYKDKLQLHERVEESSDGVYESRLHVRIGIDFSLKNKEYTTGYSLFGAKAELYSAQR